MTDKTAQAPRRVRQLDAKTRQRLAAAYTHPTRPRSVAQLTRDYRLDKRTVAEALRREGVRTQAGRRRLPAAEPAALQQAIARGETQREYAARCEVSKRTVERWTQAAGLEWPDFTLRRDKVDRARLRQLAAADVPVAFMVEDLGVSERVIYGLLDEEGLGRPSRRSYGSHRGARRPASWPLPERGGPPADDPVRD